jgi:hypothetical protein
VIHHRDLPASGVRVEAERSPTAPGLVFNGAAAGLFVVALWRGSERGGDLGSILLIAALWSILLLGWLLWAVAGAGAKAISSGHLLRWLLAPSLFVLAVALVFGGYAMQARFQLSEAALDAAADAALVDETVGPGWIGLYPVDGVSVERGRTVRFSVPGRHALVRGTPRSRDSVVWYQRIRGDWWFEVEFASLFFD